MTTRTLCRRWGRCLGWCRPKVRGRFAFPGAREPGSQAFEFHSFFYLDFSRDFLGMLLRNHRKSQQFTFGVVSKGFFLRKVWGNYAESARKFAKYMFYISASGCGNSAESCGNFAEFCGRFSAMTSSRTTPQVNC